MRGRKFVSQGVTMGITMYACSMEFSTPRMQHSLQGRSCPGSQQFYQRETVRRAGSVPGCNVGTSSEEDTPQLHVRLTQ